MENVLYREEVGRPLTYTEIDNNFKYLCNPWSYDRIYLTGMIVYHDLVPNKFNFYRAKTSLESSLTGYISNEWTKGSIKIGDYIKLTDKVYLLYTSTGSNVNDYILINDSSLDLVVLNKAIISTNDTLQEFIDIELTTISIGDLLILSNKDVYTVTSGTGNVTTNYTKLSNTDSINWANILGNPTSSVVQIDSSVSKSHNLNEDLYLNFGGVNQISALELKTHVNDSTRHFTQSQINHANIIGGSATYSHSAIDTHINTSTIHFTQNQIDHTLISNRGTNTHAQIDSHIGNAVISHTQIDNHIVNSTYTHILIDEHIDDVTLHFTQNQIDHTLISNRGTNTHADIDAHIANGSLHGNDSTLIDHTLISNRGTNSHAVIDTHIANANIHFTQNQINHTLISNRGTNTHAQIDSHIGDGSVHFIKSDISHDDILDTGFYSHTLIDQHINNASLHGTVDFTLVNHLTIQNIGVNTHSQIDNHINDNTLHFTQSQINHTNLIGKGTNTHAQIDSFITTINSYINDVNNSITDHMLLTNIGIKTHDQIDTHIVDSVAHMADTNEHIKSHLQLNNIGINSHETIDSHISDVNLHFTESSIRHDYIIGSGSRTHTEIDDHILDNNIHNSLQDIFNYVSSNNTFKNSTGINSGVINSNSTVYSDNSFISGSNNTIKLGANNSAIIGGYSNFIESNTQNTIIIGGNNIIATESNTAYLPNIISVTGLLKVGNITIHDIYDTTNSDVYKDVIIYNFNDSADYAIMFKLDISAYSKNSNDGKMWEIRGMVKQKSNLLSLVGNDISIFVTSEDSNTVTWDSSIYLDSITNDVILKIKGGILQNINWRISTSIIKNI